MKISFKNFILFTIVFIIEVIIAVFVNDNFIRPYIGDVLVIILIYYFVKIFCPHKNIFLPFYIFVFSFIIEILQYINILEMMGLHNNNLLKIVVGSTFDIKDIYCYLVGTMILFLMELFSYKKRYMGID